MLVAFEEELTVLAELVKTSNFLVQLRVDHQVEIVVNFFELSDVLVLHLTAGRALTARVFLFGEANLVDDDVVNVDFELSEFNGKALSLVKGEELRDADGNEGCLFRVLELVVHLDNLLLHDVKVIKKFLLHVFP